MQYDNEDGSLLATNDKVDSTKNYNVNVWAELYNPVPDDSTLSGMNDTIARLAAQDMAGTQQYPMYRIVLAEGDLQKDANASVRDPGNFTGDPDFNKGGNPSCIKKIDVELG
ncbi:MAG: hypothetical protein U0840_15560 [Gemmataceae bacterium]